MIGALWLLCHHLSISSNDSPCTIPPELLNERKVRSGSTERLGPKSSHPVVQRIRIHQSLSWCCSTKCPCFFRRATPQNRQGQTEIAQHITKSMHLITLLSPQPFEQSWREEAHRSVHVSSWEPLPNRNLVRGSDGISSEKCRCFFVRAPPGSALSARATDLYLNVQRTLLFHCSNL